ncbi:YhbY family RNA-binding protein [Desulfosarcina ovata]|uniref:RNA-binding protein n=2 Tax=Desulfosarcina ovata TaxID=83564 RepID=A0A5K8A7X3_9BACT|nr:YhbY family RNA-binding protein [Desulfosarcina ovata]BBO80500.1 RNA-binding protein [Desulfosarcina ovata subsp. sediminis]BBO88454.1 RNA-binding protein [Desulfosarcina ovata subsp. ovata]
MQRLQGFQKRFLRGLAHGRKPVVFVGQKGLSPSLLNAMNDALDRHELVKVKFIEFKEKEKKMAIAEQIEQTILCEMVAMVGHMATFYRWQPDPEKRKIDLPAKGK